MAISFGFIIFSPWSDAFLGGQLPPLIKHSNRELCFTFSQTTKQIEHPSRNQITYTDLYNNTAELHPFLNIYMIKELHQQLMVQQIDPYMHTPCDYFIDTYV
jgi:hypothetical protein